MMASFSVKVWRADVDALSSDVVDHVDGLEEHEAFTLAQEVARRGWQHAIVYRSGFPVAEFE